jgi:hypothetical protein
MSQDVKADTKATRAGKTKWAVAVFFVLLAVVVVKNLPRGFSDDLSSIGKGKAAVVLIRDKNAVQTFDFLELMNGMRDQYVGKVEFLLTDSNTSQGRKFMEANEAPRVTLVLLDSAGKKVKVLFPPQTAESLSQEIAALQSIQ